MNDKTEQRIENLLSMAARARRIVSGAQTAEEILRKGRGTYLLLAADASAETKRKFSEMAARVGVPQTQLMRAERLGRCLGKEYRAVAVLIDRGFADKLDAYLHEISTGVD